MKALHFPNPSPSMEWLRYTADISDTTAANVRGMSMQTFRQSALERKGMKFPCAPKWSLFPSPSWKETSLWPSMGSLQWLHRAAGKVMRDRKVLLVFLHQQNKWELLIKVWEYQAKGIGKEIHGAVAWKVPVSTKRDTNSTSTLQALDDQQPFKVKSFLKYLTPGAISRHLEQIAPRTLHVFWFF